MAKTLTLTMEWVKDGDGFQFSHVSKYEDWLDLVMAEVRLAGSGYVWETHGGAGGYEDTESDAKAAAERALEVEE